MGTLFEDLTPTLLRDAFGYNAISRIVADTPQYTSLQAGRTTATLPPQLRNRSTIYEYGSDGYLLDSYHHSFGDQYFGDTTHTGTTAMIEGLSGYSTTRPDVKYGTGYISITSGYNFRVYRCGTTGGSPDYNWVDITDGGDYTVVANVLHYTAVNTPGYHLCVISDKDFLQFSLQLSASSGVFEFVLMQEEDRGTGYFSHPLTIPYGQLDIFMGKKSLIKDIDYFVDFPVVRIINKKYLVQPAESTPQDILVRFYGFCTPGMEIEPVTDKGFVRYGQLSEDGRFNVRDDKVLRITVDGRTSMRDQVSFGEEHIPGAISDPLNGLPYQIKDIVVPMKDYVAESTYILRAQAQAIDTEVEDYLSVKLPKQTLTGLMTIQAKHPVYSPFFSTIIELMVTNAITESECRTLTGNSDILPRFAEYAYLLNSDPLNVVKDTNFSFVTVFPHARDTSVPVKANQYRVLQALVSLYGAGNIDLSKQLFITP
jgi:hypothetical protein